MEQVEVKNIALIDTPPAVVEKYAIFAFMEAAYYCANLGAGQ